MSDKRLIKSIARLREAREKELSKLDVLIGDQIRGSSAVDWGRQMPKGGGLGVSGHYSFVTYTAVAAEVVVDEKGARCWRRNLDCSATRADVIIALSCCA